MREIFGDAWPDGPPTTCALIRQPIDFLGINYYTRSVERDHRRLRFRSARKRRAAAAARPHRDGLGSARPRRSPAVSLWVKERYGEHSRSTSPRTAPRSTIRRTTIDGASRTRCASHYYREHLRAAPTRCAGRGPARLLRLVAARQLRVEPRLLEALRHRARGLRDAAAHDQGERAVLLAT